MPTQLIYVVLLFALFVVPRFLERFFIPSAITSLMLGFLASSLGYLQNDPAITLLAVFGIVALFLFAGLEIEAEDIRKGGSTLIQHLVILIFALILARYAVSGALDLEPRAAWLMALALLTPSAGFILDSIGNLGLNEEGRFWTKSMAIAAELLALGTLFVILQSSSLSRLAMASLALGVLIVLIPFLFRFFAVRIAPFAPRSEFAFLIMLAVLCAHATRELGVYYLVGAFLVGAAGQRFCEKLPAVSSEKLLHAIEAFASFFVPFYFFNAGLHLKPEHFSARAVGLGLALLVLALPLRMGLVVLHKRLVQGKSLADSTRVAVSLLPTLVFTLVLAEILRDQFGVAPYIFGGLVVYALVNTTLPGFMLKTPPPEYEAPHLSGIHREVLWHPEPASAQGGTSSKPSSEGPASFWQSSGPK